MFELRKWCIGAALLITPATSMADTVLDWNEQAVAAVLVAKQLPPDGARSMAMVHVAMFNAINAVERRYAPYGFEVRAPAHASADAAAASAARTVLEKLFPDQREGLENAFAAALKQIVERRGIDAGIALASRRPMVASPCAPTTERERQIAIGPRPPPASTFRRHCP